MVRCSEQIKKLSIRWRPPSRRGWRSCTAGQAGHEHYITIRHITSLDAVNPILTLPNVTILWSTQPLLKITSAGKSWCCAVLLPSNGFSCLSLFDRWTKDKWSMILLARTGLDPHTSFLCLTWTIQRIIWTYLSCARSLTRGKIRTTLTENIQLHHYRPLLVAPLALTSRTTDVISGMATMAMAMPTILRTHHPVTEWR